MNDWFTIQTLVALIVGVLLSTMIKSKVSAAKDKIGA